MEPVGPHWSSSPSRSADAKPGSHRFDEESMTTIEEEKDRVAEGEAPLGSESTNREEDEVEVTPSSKGQRRRAYFEGPSRLLTNFEAELEKLRLLCERIIKIEKQKVAKDPSGKEINALAQHIQNLFCPSTPFFFNTLYDPYRKGADFVRGYPFSLREGLPTAVSHGLWLNIPDYDAPTQLAQYIGVKTKEWFEVNSRGLEIFSKSWFPEDSPTKALVCFCHGYGDTCTFFFEGIAKKLASSGYGVFRLDYPGFGLSEGLHGYIASFDNLVDDVVEHFSKIKENPEYRGLPSFLFGESMGGAVALKVHFKQHHGWNGAILVVPMCKMADDVVPPWPVQQVLIGLAKFFPKEKLVPQKNLTEMAFKDLKKREQYSYNAICYKDRPCLRTAVELLRTTQEIKCRLEEVAPMPPKRQSSMDQHHGAWINIMEHWLI